MNSSEKLLIGALKGTKGKRAPFWFMRQAGRYLPEYRELRGKAKSFLDFCYTPAMASEATLQPIRRFGMDGAIIFSDILVIPHALGVDVRFEEGKGPLLAPVQDEKQLAALSADRLKEKLAPVYEALALAKKNLPTETTLIGFVGAPWTLACYVVNGSSDRGFAKVREIARQQRPFFSRLMTMLSEAVAAHAIAQIEAGAEIIQIFDSWAGVLDDEEFAQWSVAPAAAIVQKIRKAHPQIPIIGFPREAKHNYALYAQKTGVNAISVDQSVPLDKVKTLQKCCIVQGNLDPELLAGDKNAMLAQAQRIIETLGDKAFVFNLGHGILPHTPVEHMQALCENLRSVVPA